MLFVFSSKRHGNTIEKLEKDADSRRDNIGKYQQQLQQMMMKQAGKWRTDMLTTIKDKVWILISVFFFYAWLLCIY